MKYHIAVVNKMDKLYKYTVEGNKLDTNDTLFCFYIKL